MNELIEKNMIKRSEIVKYGYADINDENIVPSILYLTFFLENELYGFPVSSVREVMKFNKVFKTPGVPRYIKGVMNLRGEVVPVIDLTYRFYKKEGVVNDDTDIIVLEVMDNDEVVPIGVMIDSVQAVVDIREDDIKEASEVGSKIRTDFFNSIGIFNNQFIILLNVERVLYIDELSKLNE